MSDDWGFATELEDVSGRVAICGVGDSDYSKASGRTTHEIVLQAVERALDDAGLGREDIDGIMSIPSMGEQVDDVAVAGAVFTVAPGACSRAATGRRVASGSA